ncbi:MAG: hypothetical protein AB4080_06765 [Trichodesmium sp.]
MIFKGACQKLSRYYQLVEFIKEYTLQIIVKIGKFKGVTFSDVCQLAELDRTIISKA